MVGDFNFYDDRLWCGRYVTQRPDASGRALAEIYEGYMQLLTKPGTGTFCRPQFARYAQHGRRWTDVIDQGWVSIAHRSRIREHEIFPRVDDPNAHAS
jgi:hypothetical protein